MFCHALIGVVFYAALICKGSCDEAKLIDRLNRTLSFPGWVRFANVAAKYRFPVNGNGWFAGKDVFVDNRSAVINTLVGEDDERRKHYQVTHLLGCVYANALLKFIGLLKNILEEGNRARQNNGKKLNRKRKKSANAVRGNKPAPDQPPLEGFEGKSKNPVDDEKELLETSWTIFNFAVLQLGNSRSMFGRMFGTMKCLIDTTPSGESFDKYTQEMLVILLLPRLKLFKDVSENITLALPTIDEPKYTFDNACSLSHQLTCFLASQAKSGLRPFLNDHCAVSEEAVPSFNTIIGLWNSENITKPTYTDIALQFGFRIEQLVLEVCNDYHTQLGFQYNDSDGTTSFPRPLPQLTDSIDEIETSQNIDN